MEVLKIRKKSYKDTDIFYEKLDCFKWSGEFLPILEKNNINLIRVFEHKNTTYLIPSGNILQKKAMQEIESIAKETETFYSFLRNGNEVYMHNSKLTKKLKNQIGLQ